MEQKIAKIIKETINKYLVTHTPILGDTRCRLDVLAEEAAREILNEVSVAASRNFANGTDKESTDWWHKRNG